MLPVWNVFFGLGVDVFFGQAKVNDVDNVFLFIPLPSDEKVFRFYVSIDEVFRVHVLHSRNLGRKNTAESAKRQIKSDLITKLQSQQNEDQDVKITPSFDWQFTAAS